ncbi:MAG: hypothetical protein IPK26_11360 [Planctomycetes bacterium]|nr:hypothetical protein [Planctomycetota bacterium]
MSAQSWRVLPLFLVGALPAQVTPGHVVGAHFHVGVVPGLGGLYVHHPTGAVPAAPIGGLRSDLTGSIASGTQFCGANAIAAVDTAGTTFYVGEMTDDTLPASWSVDLHEVVVRFVPGSGYVGTDRVVATLNTVPGPVPNSPQRQISGIAVVPGTADAIVVCAGFDFAGTPLVRYSPNNPGTVTPILAVGLPGAMANAIAIDPTGTTMWIGTFVDLQNGVISAMPVQGGSATTIANLPAGVSSLAYDTATGHLWVACLGGPPNLFDVDPATGSVTAIPVPIGTINAIAFETATGQCVTGGGGGGIPPVAFGRVSSTGGSIVQAPPGGGWGAMAGVAVIANPWQFCVATPTATTALDWVTPWALAAQPLHGLPNAGNAGFGVSLRTRPGRPFAGVLVISFGSLEPGVPLFGGTVCLDLLQPSTALLISSPTATFSLPLGLPANVAGTRLALQAAAFDGAGFAFSRALGVQAF